MTDDGSGHKARARRPLIHSVLGRGGWICS